MVQLSKELTIRLPSINSKMGPISMLESSKVAYTMEKAPSDGPYKTHRKMKLSTKVVG
jgi:hypothetical protein